MAAMRSLCLAVLLAGVLLCASAYTPKMKWSQTKTKLTLALDVACTSEPEVAFGADTLTFSCQDQQGETAEIDAVFREDINPSESSCTKTRVAVNCLVIKLLEHRWDRLFFDAAAYKPHISIDWTRYDEDVEEGDADDSDHAGFYTDEAKGHVRILGEDRFEEARSKKDLLVLDVSYPWCDVCTFTRQHFGEAAEHMKDQKDDILFGYVDPLENRELRHFFNPNCSHECAMYLVKAGEPEPIKVELSPSAQGIVARANAYAGPLLKPIKSEADLAELKMADEMQPATVVAFVNSENDGEVDAVKNLARKHRGDVPFGIVVGSTLDLEGVALPSLVLFRTLDDEKAVLTDFSQDLDDWFSSASLPTFVKYDWKINGEMQKRENVPVGYLFHDHEDDKDLLDQFKAVASEFAGKLVVMHLSKSENYMMPDFGLDKDTFPSFGIKDDARYEAHAYGLVTDMPVSPDQVRSFIQDYLDGKAVRTRKSERPPSPKDISSDKPLKVVFRTLEEKVHKVDKPVLLVAYRQFSEKWKTLGKIIDEIARATKNVEDFTVGTYDVVNNAFDADLLPHVKEFDTKDRLVLFTGSGEDRKSTLFSAKKITRTEILKWLKKRVKAVADAWDSIQAEIAAIKEENKAAQEETKAAEQAAEAELAEFEKVDITGDGGIVKHIKEHGTGDATPSDGDQVKAHYTGRLLDGTVFDSSVDRGEPFEFHVGKGHVIPCWDKGFKSMKKGEKAFLTCKPEHAYGERAMGKIPAGSTLRFEVELLEFEPGHDEL